MENIIELKTRDGKPRTYKMNGGVKKLYINPSNPKVHYIRHNKKYIPKDEYKKINNKKNKNKKKMRGGEDKKINIIVILELSSEGEQKQEDKYRIATCEFDKVNDVNISNVGLDIDEKKNSGNKDLISAIKKTTAVKFDYYTYEVYIFFVQMKNNVDATISLSDIKPNILKSTKQRAKDMLPFNNSSNPYQNGENLNFKSIEVSSVGNNKLYNDLKLEVFLKLYENFNITLQLLGGKNYIKLISKDNDQGEEEGEEGDSADSTTQQLQSTHPLLPRRR